MRDVANHVPHFCGSGRSGVLFDFTRQCALVLVQQIGVDVLSLTLEQQQETQWGVN